MAGRAGVIRARLDLRRSTRRTGHLQRRVLRRPTHAIVAVASRADRSLSQFAVAVA
jgi:hypothetical protein